MTQLSHQEYWAFRFWNRDQDPLNDAPMFEFCLLQQYDDDEKAFPIAAQIAGRTDDFAPCQTWGTTPYNPHPPIGVIKFNPKYARPYTSDILFPCDICPEHINSFFTEEEARQALYKRANNVEIVSPAEFDKEAYKF